MELCDQNAYSSLKNQKAARDIRQWGQEEGEGCTRTI